MRIRASQTVLAALVLAGACGDEPPRPQGPATVEARLESPNGAEGAALLELTGRFSDVEQTATTTLMAEQVNDSTARLLLISKDGGQLTFRIHLPEQSRPPRVKIVEVADPADVLRATLDKYRVRF